MFYTIYKITNQLDGKFYIGSHKTKELNDNYMGSGKYLKRAQEKYGIENFKKEILFVFDTAEEMYAKEAEIVNEDFLVTQNTYNLMEGGDGGFSYINSSGQNGTQKGVEKRLELMRDEFWFSYWKEKQREGCILHSQSIPKEEFSRRGKKANQTAKEKNGCFSFENKKHTEKAKQEIGRKNSINQQGEKNSQFGSMWITNNEESKKIKKDDPIPEGWRKGRK